MELNDDLYTILENNDYLPSPTLVDLAYEASKRAMNLKIVLDRQGHITAAEMCKYPMEGFFPPHSFLGQA